MDLVQALQATLEPEPVATALVSRMAAWIPATCWGVVAPDRDGQVATLCEKGLTASLEPALRRVADWVIAHDQVCRSGDLSADARFESAASVAAVAWPLRGRERVVGAIVGVDTGISDRAPVFSAALDRALTDLIGTAALTLDAVLLLERTEALSVTDDLTRLYNARYLNLALRRETRLAARTSRPLSLLFIDLDGFKSINDSHGHLAGSRALVEAGRVIRGSARETDIVARFGGDEFALILPDTPSPGALQVAERIRDRIARHEFLAGDGLNIHLTASVGVATLPDVAAAADELVQAADAAMYRVKDRGKNGIQAAVPDR
ncbi:MAG: GGDEF domain-containing protein [Acidobacteria bacterium]|nr:GGDEF domain-containing protein [Acidobacteriota bacterium]